MNTRTLLLWHNNGEERIYFTVNPAALSVSRPSCNRRVFLAMGGSINIWGGRGLREIRLSTFLPWHTSPFYGGQPPESVLAMLRRWQDSGDPVRLILSGSDINDAFLIEDVTEIFREGDMDVGVSLTLREYKFKSDLAASADLPGVLPAARTYSRPDERSLPASYTVKKGDTLWDIASRLYGDGTRWRELSERNGLSDPKKLQIGRTLLL